MRIGLQNAEPIKSLGVTTIMLALAINWGAVGLAIVVAFSVLCLLTSLILKELNKHR